MLTQVFIGDVILAVNDVDVANKPLAVAKPLLQGPPGASVRLRLFRVGTGETMVTLVRHLPSSSGLLGTPDPMAPPVHRLVRWDEKSKKQISEVCPMSKNTPKGHVDIVIIDVQNLPVSYEMGWSISSSLLGSILSNPYVVAKQGGVTLQSSVQSNKLSAAYNQTLRLPVSALEDLVIQVRNNDAIEAGDLIGEVVFPIQQLARVGEVQTGRFRLSVAGESKTRIPVLQGMQVGEVVTGLKGRPSSVALELHYNGEPYEELRANHQAQRPPSCTPRPGLPPRGRRARRARGRDA